jgi:hypothetical protein
MSLGSPTVLFYVFVLLAQLVTGLYVASGIETPPLFDLLSRISFLWILGWWLRADTEKRQVPWVYDMGFFLYLAWPFIMLHYLVESRGVRGLLLIVTCIAIYIGSGLTGVVLYLLLAPSHWPRW